MCVCVYAWMHVCDKKQVEESELATAGKEINIRTLTPKVVDCIVWTV